MSNEIKRGEYEVDITLDLNDVTYMNYSLEDLTDGLITGILSNSFAGITGNDGREKEKSRGYDWLCENYAAVSGTIKLANCMSHITAMYLEALDTRRVSEYAPTNPEGSKE